MPKKTHKPVKFTAEEGAYELPAKIEIKRLRPAGGGPEATRKLMQRSTRLVGLDADVARDFSSSDEVNEALRLVKQLRQLGKKQPKRKSA